MVLVDFTLAERWRVFGELSLAPVRKTRAPAIGPIKQPALSADTARVATVARIDPQESAARSHAQAAFMQRML